MEVIKWYWCVGKEEGRKRVQDKEIKERKKEN